MNLGDPELELIDPTPNVQSLFIHFDKQFFWTKLESRSAVRWSKRMYSCAGMCTYDRGGFCDIALSEPLLKLRPRKDLVETLLHEMIHAFLFVTNQDHDGRDGHGPIFQAHMHRINKHTGLNISIYHNFYEEVELYQTHWWRCNGPCQRRRPNFGIVRRNVNTPPSPKDYWWFNHMRNCGGTFIKIKEPEKKGKKTKNPVVNQNNVITNYINNNSKIVNNNVPLSSSKPVLKDLKNLPVKAATISNEKKIVVVTQKGLVSPNAEKPLLLFGGIGQTLNGGRQRTNSDSVVESVRSIWSNKQLPVNNLNNRLSITKEQVKINSNTGIKAIKHKTESVHKDSPPAKVKKISDYFNTTGTSILKDLYGQDFKIVKPDGNNKLVAVAIKSELVDCPICTNKVSNEEINRHLDECLNKEVIEDLTKNKLEQRTDKFVNPVDILKHTESPVEKVPDKWCDNLRNTRELKRIVDQHNILNTAILMAAETNSTTTEDTNSAVDFDPNDVNKVKSIVKKINYDKHVRNSGNFILPKTEKAETVDVGYLPSFLDDSASRVKNPPVKIEPGTSKDIVSQLTGQFCACCGNKLDKRLEEHLDECLAFFTNNTTIPGERASTSFADQTIVIDDEDDIFDETLTLNATGTKHPCPCCLEMIEEAEMNVHLDQCLS